MPPLNEMVIIHDNPDGSVAVMYHGIGKRPGETDADFLDRIMAAAPPGTNPQIVHMTVVPVSRKFHAAWVRQGNAIEVDMPKARAIHMERIRQVRNQKLTDLDIDYQIADDNNNAPQKTAIAQHRRDLRALPANTDLDQFATPEILDDFWPIELPTRA